MRGKEKIDPLLRLTINNIIAQSKMGKVLVKYSTDAGFSQAEVERILLNFSRELSQKIVDKVLLTKGRLN